MTDLLSELEAVPVVAYAWRKEGMNGWALGHNPPTPNMPDFDKYEVRELTFRTHHAEIAAAVRDARLLDFMERECIAIRCEASDDDSVWYDAVDFHMAEPKERIVGTGSTPREALIAAMRAGEGEG